MDDKALREAIRRSVAHAEPKKDLIDRIEKLEAKLAKAVEFFDFLDENYRHVWGDTARSKIRALYVELKGQNDER